MSLSLCILASGSSGNCSVVRTPQGVMLIDAGLSPRATARRLEVVGVGLAEIRAICLTHLDADHYQPGWQSVIVRNRIRVFCSRHQRRLLLDRPDHPLEPLVRGLDGNVFEPLSGVAGNSIDLRHDDDGCNGFVLHSRGTSLGFATDLGRVPWTLVDAFAGVDLLAIESNYDPRMQIESSRPAFLKNRIMNGRGHLSNEQAFEAVVRVMNLCEQTARPLPSQVVLLHRSRECNCPMIIRKLFHRDARLVDRLHLAEQDEPSGWIHPVPRRPALGQQLSFGWAAAG